MAKQLHRITALLIASFSTLFAYGQNATPMADAMRENGKIYVVVVVLAIIFVGIVVYLITIDRKTARLKKELDEMKK